ncbi:hypothetical protein P3342_007933 [Pyrenophora teres f. teres]|nr:hypothetical protein P3342_007933 [Pyrenophora teres f. teres]
MGAMCFLHGKAKHMCHVDGNDDANVWQTSQWTRTKHFKNIGFPWKTHKIQKNYKCQVCNYISKSREETMIRPLIGSQNGMVQICRRLRIPWSLHGAVACHIETQP